MIEFHYTHNHTPKCSRYKKQTNSYTTHICNRSTMFCPVLYTFQEFWSKYLLTDLVFQTGILIKVLVLSWKRRWWRLICTLSKSHFAVSPSMSAARRQSLRRRSPRGPMAAAARAASTVKVAARRNSIGLSPSPLSLSPPRSCLGCVQTTHCGTFYSQCHTGDTYSKLVLGSIPFLLSR